MTNKTRKRGIALIIVLGMLALLVMVGVSFSIFMRTERQAAGSFQHDVRARQLLYASAARAIQTINENMVGKSYPTDNYWVSPGSNFFAVTTNQAWAPHVPDSLLKQIPNAASWVSVPNNGRIGFLILNASGLLDANATGGAARGTGVDPTEIQLSELRDITNINTFIQNRKYESVAQMKRAGTAVGLNHTSELVPFSLLSTNQPGLPPVDISGDEFALDKEKANIVNRFGQLSLDGNAVFEYLRDYVDPDSRPSNPMSPTTEKIPMINEIRIRPRLTRTGPATPDILNLALMTSVEVCYPFVSPPASTEYDLVYTILFERMAGTDPGFPLPTVPPSSTIKLNTDASWSGQPFLDVALAIPNVQVSIAALVGKTGAFRLRITEMKIVERASGTVVDSLQAPMVVGGYTDAAMKPRPGITVPAAAPVQPLYGDMGGSECLDPRYNYRLTFWRNYKQVVDITGKATDIDGSPAAINAWTSFWLREKNNDGHMWMHVADKPIQSVGELSYIVRGGSTIDDTWKTLRLLDERSPADPLYDHFTVPLTNAISRGLVNPNTDSKPVLASVLKDMQLDRYPGDTADAAVCRISSAEAKQLATAWMSDPTWAAGYSNKQSMVGNLAYKKAVSNLVNSMALVSAPAAAEFRVEAAFRNMMGLMDPRQNYFYIILFAQSSTQVQLPRVGDAEGVFIDTVRSDQIGLLELWRDPVMRTAADGSTHYPMLIRRFEILSQE